MYIQFHTLCTLQSSKNYFNPVIHCPRCPSSFFAAAAFQLWTRVAAAVQHNNDQSMSLNEWIWLGGSLAPTLINFDCTILSSDEWIVPLLRIFMGYKVRWLVSLCVLNLYTDCVLFLRNQLDSIRLSFLSSTMSLVIATNKVEDDQRSVEWDFDHFEWMNERWMWPLLLLRDVWISAPVNLFQQPKLISFRINQAIIFWEYDTDWTMNDISRQFTTVEFNESESEMFESVTLEICKHYLLKLDTTTNKQT